MTKCTYLILSLAQSELEVEGSPFAVVVRYDDLETQCIRGYVRSDWHNLIASESGVETSYVVDLLFDLRQAGHKPRHTANIFFAAIASLGIGPVRTSASSVCYLPNPAILDVDMTDNNDLLTCSPQLFYQLLQTLAVWSSQSHTLNTK